VETACPFREKPLAKVVMDMRRLALVLMVVLGTGSGCGTRNEVAVETPPVTSLPRGVPMPDGEVDDFGLPLRIVLDPPPVPPELLKPSPPITQPTR
jgi:hypothetical protein